MTKVSLEVELGVLRNYPKQFMNSVEVTGVLSYNMRTVEKHQVMFSELLHY